MFSEYTQKNKLEILGKLTASLAHEMRNPLSAVKLNLEFIKMSSQDLPKEINGSLDECMQGIKMIESLIENILSFSRKKIEETTYVSINFLTVKAVELSIPKANKKNIVIEKELSANLPEIEFNPSQLLQVFLNLISNSIEACDSSNGHIIIKTYLKKENPQDEIIWEIHDNGIGIEDHHKDQIFGEFFTNKENGTGLGLTVCRSILEEQNAQLSFVSTYGKGTTFKIRFNNCLRDQNAE